MSPTIHEKLLCLEQVITRKEAITEAQFIPGHDMILKENIYK